MLTVVIPIRTVSEANAHEHWRNRQRRAKEHRRIAQWMCIQHVPQLPCKVLLTRVSQRLLDDDNLQGALKHVRDGVADAFGVNDRDPRIAWRYAQERCPKGKFCVKIEFLPVD